MPGNRLQLVEGRQPHTLAIEILPALLEAALKQAKAAGKLPPELRAFLQKQMLGFDEESAKKRAKKELDEHGNH